MKKYFLQLTMVLITIPVFSQQSDPVLVKIDKAGITRSEFESSYNKDGKGMSLKEYLNIFIDNKLKISQAKSLGIDTTAAFTSRISGYQKNVSKSYFLKESIGDVPLKEVHANRNQQGKNAYVEGLQIYRYLPQNTSSARLNEVEREMETLYNTIKNNSGTNFTALVNRYSNDRDTFRVCRLEMPEEFEEVVFNMHIGEISRPFFTPQGIHIVKVLDRRNEIPFEELQRKSAYTIHFKNINDESILNKIKSEANYSPNQDALRELQSAGYTDKVLFTINGKQYTGKDFAYFSQDNTKNLPTRINDFIRKSLYGYEDNKLNAKYAGASGTTKQENRDDMLLVYMNQVISEKNWEDKDLEEYFNDHKKEYRWELPRYRGIVVHTKDKKTGKQIKKQLKNVPEMQWTSFLEKIYNSQSPDVVIAEQGTFAVAQNPFVDKKIFKVGNYAPLKSHPFTTIIGKKAKGPESLEEVREEVAKDYKDYLEENWIAYLRKKSKVEINEEVLKTVNNH